MSPELQIHTYGGNSDHQAPGWREMEPGTPRITHHIYGKGPLAQTACHGGLFGPVGMSRGVRRPILPPSLTATQGRDLTLLSCLVQSSRSALEQYIGRWPIVMIHGRAARFLLAF